MVYRGKWGLANARSLPCQQRGCSGTSRQNSADLDQTGRRGDAIRESTRSKSTESFTLSVASYWLGDTRVGKRVPRDCWSSCSHGSSLASTRDHPSFNNHHSRDTRFLPSNGRCAVRNFELCLFFVTGTEKKSSTRLGATTELGHRP